LVGMCDCYIAHCVSCGKPIPMHLEDFNTARDEILVYCGRAFCHPSPPIREKYPWWVVWKIPEEIPKEYGKDAQLRRHAEKEIAELGGFKIIILPLTDTGKLNYLGNCPNMVVTRDFEVIDFRNEETQREWLRERSRIAQEHLNKLGSPFRKGKGEETG